MSGVFIGFVGLLGLVVGSFVNVVIVRVPSEESVVSPHFKCPDCGTAIEPRDNIPIVSWFWLRGRCRACGEPIHWGYPTVEAINAILWAVAAARFGPELQLVPYLLLFSALLALSAIDVKIYRLPDRITLPSIVASLVLIPAVSLTLDDPGQAILTAAIGGAGYFVFLFIFFFVYPKGMGFGDVKLVGLMGLYLGWVTPGTEAGYVPVLVVLSLIIAAAIGLIVGVGVLIARRGRSQPYPFGPALALGCVLAILSSDHLLDIYGLSPA